MKNRISKLQYQQGICLIVFLGVLICILQLGSTGLVDETPPLFASASRAMSETGNWLTPRVNGLNRFDKPPLIYWLMGLFYSLPSHSIWDPLGTWAARLPSALSTVFMMIVLGDTLMKSPENNIDSPRKTAVIASLAFALSPLVLIWSRIAVSDALLCCTLGTSLILNWRTYVSNKNQRWWLPWIFLGLAVLTKGPVALVLTALTFLIFGFVQRDYLYLFKRTKPFKGFLIACFISAPWYIAELVVEGKPFWDSFFGYHNLQRLTSVVNNHSQPWWFFIIIGIISSIPFTPFLIISILDFASSCFTRNKITINRLEKSLLKFSASWLFAVFSLFTIAATKLPSYWLPATPAVAILIALSASKIKRNETIYRTSYLVIAIFMLALALLFSFPKLWIYYIDDPEMPYFSYKVLESSVTMRAAFCCYSISIISFYFTLNSKFRSIIFIQLPIIIFQIIVMLPIWDLADNLRQKPLRQLANQILITKRENESIAMVGIIKPSIHFYTKQIVLYESNDKVSFVNLSERLRLEKREKWKTNKIKTDNYVGSFILIIDNQTSDLPHWQELKHINLGSYGIYQIWRVEKSEISKRELKLRESGILPNWRLPKDERF